ncbi:MAG TPA: response regulator [Burkholderiaceae bacterium]|nr:response regulator [Burkholderiaceae bacterium]
MSDPAAQAPTILYVDDEATALKYFQRALGALANVITAESVEEGKRLLDAHADTLAVLVSDQRMPGANGNELLFYAWDRHPHVVRILTTAYSELEQTVEAVNQGQIHRYIQKPWDISALRMELKQALDLAALRKDHNQLLREKLLVRQKQTIANRVAMLYALCSGLSERGAHVAVEASLGAAMCAGLEGMEPDWLMYDYADLTGSEVMRCAALGDAVRAHLARIEQRCPGQEAEQALLLLAEHFGPMFEATGGGGGMFLQPAMLMEFLALPTQAAPSAAHAYWLACLLWLGRRGHAMQLTADGSVLRCQLTVADASFGGPQLAAWIGQL